ncbi:hypothetical protein EST38_g1469 [Candolleomyces aberdarensis]|uniref:Uncharacterized protein n=1 Tax=Candolleomyces aberdarensis TaxID=2316362 RepID=A0A4Q2DYG4_9AGAR|nr:hypothetical protein EST38_g1469 [Candolleomyces aberdarensis]
MPDVPAFRVVGHPNFPDEDSPVMTPTTPQMQMPEALPSPSHQASAGSSAVQHLPIPRPTFPGRRFGDSDDAWRLSNLTSASGGSGPMDEEEMERMWKESEDLYRLIQNQLGEDHGSSSNSTADERSTSGEAPGMPVPITSPTPPPFPTQAPPPSFPRHTSSHRMPGGYHSHTPTTLGEKPSTETFFTASVRSDSRAESDSRRVSQLMELGTHPEEGSGDAFQSPWEGDEEDANATIKFPSGSIVMPQASTSGSRMPQPAIPIPQPSPSPPFLPEPTPALSQAVPPPSSIPEPAPSMPQPSSQAQAKPSIPKPQSSVVSHTIPIPPAPSSPPPSPPSGGVNPPTQSGQHTTGSGTQKPPVLPSLSIPNKPTGGTTTGGGPKPPTIGQQQQQAPAKPPLSINTTTLTPSNNGRPPAPAKPPPSQVGGQSTSTKPPPAGPSPAPLAHASKPDSKPTSNETLKPSSTKPPAAPSPTPQASNAGSSSTKPNNSKPSGSTSNEPHKPDTTHSNGGGSGGKDDGAANGNGNGDNGNTRYVSMLLALDDIPPYWNLLASFFTWILLAGFLLFPGTFTSWREEQAQATGAAGVTDDVKRAVLGAVDHVPLFVIAFLCSGLGAVGMIGLSYRWAANYIWILNKVFVPGFLNSLAGLLSTLANIYGAQGGQLSTTALVTLIVTASCTGVTAILTLIYQFWFLRRVQAEHKREAGVWDAGKRGEGVKRFLGASKGDMVREGKGKKSGKKGNA